MDKDRRLWDEFWAEKEDIVIQGPIKTWHQLVWNVGLRYWDEVFKLARGKRTLECGCGSAQVSAHLARRGYQTTMLDSSEEGLKFARRNFRRLGLSGIFVCADVKDSAFRENSFDVVMSIGSLEHFRDVRDAIRAMIRVLKPGGLFVADIVTRRFSAGTLGKIECFCARFLKRLFLLRFENIIKESLRIVPVYKNSIPKSEYQDIMKEEGLLNVKITGTRPFPYLVLPQSVERIYVKLLQQMLWLWKRFDLCELRFTDMWGLGWYVHGIKK